MNEWFFDLSMNFLSHFYFDKGTENSYHVLGTVLPDLLKNADKTIVLHPEKLNHTKKEINYIIRGWNKHLEVDRYFHSSPFFLTHSHELKKLLAPALVGSPVKPFFLGHIALELILDSLLVTTGEIAVDNFYDHLNNCEIATIGEFLTFSGLNEATGFFNFYDDFKRSRYLHSYAETKEIAYALKRICMRIWKNPFSPENESKMSDILLEYRVKLLNEFTLIFDEIGLKLNIA
jgi:hypothetical protein